VEGTIMDTSPTAKGTIVPPDDVNGGDECGASVYKGY
jgi:hypothetical protein